MKTINSYRTIIKTTGLIGVVQVFQMVFGLFRNKVLAIIVGTQGFGIWGLYNAYVEMVTQISILGLDQSGVRQIAKNQGDQEKVSQSIYILKFAIFYLCLFATLISIIFSEYVSEVLFGNLSHHLGIIIVSLAILFNGIYRCQKSILNGLRYIRELAISQILGAVLGSLLAITVIILLKEKGIAIYLLCVPLTATIITLPFIKRVRNKTNYPKICEMKKEFKSLISIGIAFSISGVISTVMTYFSRVFLKENFNLETLGIYQASWTISNLYIGTILTAMGVDLMPRLMKTCDNDRDMNALVNEQMELGMLVAVVGVLGILVLSPFALEILYSEDFLKGTTIIRWQVLGVSLRVLAFPFSYAIMAKGKTIVYIIVQTIFWVTEFGLLIFFSKRFGFNGLGINYFFGYAIYFFMTLYSCKYIFNFKFSKLLKKIIYISYVFIGTTFIGCYFLSPTLTIIFGLVFIVAHLSWANLQLRNHMDIDVLEIIRKKMGKKFNDV